MIVSFHPIIEAQRNIICAGRQPDARDLAAIRSADAVILPQGCSAALYRMARAHCPNVFPNLDVRFDFPGKIGQVRLFRQLGVAHPATRIYEKLADFSSRSLDMDFPVVVKLNWGGQGETVFTADHLGELNRIIDTRVAASENTGRSGFLVQSMVRTPQRCLRVVLVGTWLASYWRIQTVPGRFGTSVADNARIDHDADPHLQDAARAVVMEFQRRTGLQLAGFDFLFEQSPMAEANAPEPLMLEINYFFGRSGIGGSQRYYRILRQQVDRWLAGL
jgi:ribosomal protein S6--L-glutamate ligase